MKEMKEIKEIKEKLLTGIESKNIISDASMAEYTSFKAGGNADLLVFPQSPEELKFVFEVIKGCGSQIQYMLLGNGSNVLVRDGGYRGIIIKLGEGFRTLSCDGGLITAGTAMLMSEVANFALKHSLSGFEFASGIPGSIGGAIFMNAGAYGGEIKDIAERVTVFDVESMSVKTARADELELSYRHSILQENGNIALSVGFRLEPADSCAIEAEMRELKNRRNSKQPVQYPSAGSFFKRPEGHFVGPMVEGAELKGLSVGGAQVSQLHGGFIINTGGATATDILQLMRLVQNTVYDKYGVKLEPEVRIVGEE